jgi:serine/threonine-protein kinase
MDDSQWTRAHDIFNDLVEATPDDPAAWLDRHCPDDAIRSEVERLLDAYAHGPLADDDTAAGWLEAGHEGAAAERASGSAHGTGSRPSRVGFPGGGAQVGAYRLIEEVGVGGMSVVYRAERAEGDFEQTVAVKLLRRRLRADDTEARFRAERQVLASLDHPNIAQLIDGGVTEGGRPYLVMEYIDGTPLTDYVQARSLDTGARLNLLEQVLEAVQAAHRQLVVHRDLKPSNVLVTETEHGPQVKLLDFGIAKLLGDALPVTRPVTQTGHHLMTPSYAAPEQVTDDDITTRTDVYQCGVLAYELLTGTPPFDLSGKPLTEMERIVLKETPSPPSERASERASASEASASGQTSEASASEQASDAVPPGRLRGDLDTLVRKALRKEPERRYRSVEAMATDLRRHRADEPVEARPATLRYRVRKFVHRNRTAVGSGLLILLLLVGYAITITVQAERIQTERNEAQAVTAFLVDLFEGADPLRVAGASPADSMSLRTLLDRGARRVRTELGGQPSVRARLMAVIGDVYTDTGRYPEADSLLQAALALQRSGRADASAAERAQTQEALAYSRFRQGKFEEAERLYRDALATLRRAYGPRDARLASVLNGLGIVLDERGDPAAAERVLRRAIDLHRAARDSVPAVYYHNLALALERQNRFDDALGMHQKALAVYRQAYSRPHPLLASAIARMAFTYQRAGHLEKAERLHRQSLAMRREALPPDHPHLASGLVRLGWLLVQKGRPDEAAPLAREGLSILQSILPPDHWQIHAARSVLALCAMAEGRLGAATPPLRTAFDRFRRTFGVQDWRTKTIAQALARLYKQRGRPDSAAYYARWRSETPAPAATQ